MQFRKVGIVGAGTMGRGIAQTVAASNMDVVILELDEASCQRAVNGIAANLDRAINRWGMTESEKKAILHRLSTTLDPQDLASVDIIMEAVPEQMEFKVRALKPLHDICPMDTVFTCNTATLSITELATAVGRPDRTLGMHFFYPVPDVKLVEVIRGLQTSEDTYRVGAQLVAALGKKAILVNESPGYVTTRVIVPLLNEAMYTVMEGVSSTQEVDDAVRIAFNLHRGPLTMADQIGLDEVMRWMEHLFRELGELKYRPCPLLRKLVRAGHYGVKTGRGFFVYDEYGHRVQDNIVPARSNES